MKCSKMNPCLTCPFRKERDEAKGNALLIQLSKLALAEKEIACIEDSGEIRCAGAIIHASLSLKVFKSKKLRYYQTKLGKNNEILSKEDLLELLEKKN